MYHDFFSGRGVRKDNEEMLLCKEIEGTKKGIEINDKIYLSYKGRKTLYLVVKIEYLKTKFKALILFLKFIT